MAARVFPIIFLVLVARAVPALACECEVPGVELVAPVDGAVDVPPNTRVWLGSRTILSVPQVALRRSVDGVGVPADVTTIDVDGVPFLTVLTPLELLSDGTQYIVAIGDAPVSTFTVGSEADTEPPAAPRLTVESATGGLPLWLVCGGGLGRGSSFVNLVVQHDGLLVIVDMDDASSYDPGRVAGQVTAVTTGLDTLVQLGNGQCLTGWREAGPLVSARVRAASIDLAGNISPFSAAVDVTIPPPGCTCSSSHLTSRPPAEASVLGLLIAFMASRRRLCRLPTRPA